MSLPQPKQIEIAVAAASLKARAESKPLVLRS
jgi:hypothetical protein